MKLVTFKDEWLFNVHTTVQATGKLTKIWTDSKGNGRQVLLMIRVLGDH
jgi:hypothetical protein